VDASLLDERLRAQEASAPASALPEAPGGTARVDAAAGGAAAVAAAPVTAPGGGHRWELVPGGRHRSAVVARAPGVRLDLDGVAKGWLADRALALLRWPGALVDADGDIAIRCAPGDAWEIGIGDPRDDDALLAILRLPGGLPGEGRYGVATSGTSVHRWGDASDARHHLIDPATGVSARSDVVQATVIAHTAREAEAYAKLIVIRGAAAGLGFVEHADALGAVALLDSGRTVALPRTSRFLA
jgi:thiamine biosynthesis lipoprotein ApbE